MWVLKLKSNGDIEWEKRYHQNKDYLHEGAFSARQTSDSGYIVVGWMNSNGGIDIIAMKLASDGSIVWQKDIGRTDRTDDVAYSVEQTSDGGYRACNIICVNPFLALTLLKCIFNPVLKKYI